MQAKTTKYCFIMKKYTSFLCALTILFSANAAPQRQHQSLSELKAQKEVKVTLTKAAQAKSETKKPVFKARLDETTSNIVRYNIWYSANENVIEYYLHDADEDGTNFAFRFALAEDKHDIELNKEYSLDEMIAEGCYWDKNEYDEEYDPITYSLKSATFKKTKGTGYDIHIEATIVDENDSTFTLLYNELPVQETGETVRIAFNRVMQYEYYDHTRSWWLRSTENNYNVDLQYFSTNSASPDGQFGGEDVDLYNTYVSFPTDELDEWDEPIFKTVRAKDGTIFVQSQEGGSRIDVIASFLGEDGVNYSVTMYYALPKAEKQDTIEAKNLYFDTWSLGWGQLQVYGGDVEDKYVGLTLGGASEEDFLKAYTIEPGDYSSYGEVTVNHESFNVYSGSVTFAYENGKYLLTGKVLCWNNVEYVLHITEPDAVVTQVTFESEHMILDQYSYVGESWFEIAGFDADRNYLLLSVLSNAVAGTYTLDNCDQDYTYLTIGEDNYAFTSLDLKVEYDAAKKTATATGKASLVNVYDQYDLLDLTINVIAGPYVPSVRDVTIGAFSIDYYDVEGVQAIQYNLLSQDEQQIFGLNFATTKWIADVAYDKTYTTADMYEDGSYGKNAAEREYIVYQTVEFTKSATETGVKILVKILDTRGNTWNLTYEGENVAPSPFEVYLGQANLFQHGEGAIEYEMVDIDNTLKCVLVIPTEDEDVENDRTYFSENGEIDLVDSYLSILGTEYNLTEASFHKESYGDNVEINATIKDERGYQFRLVFYDDGLIVTGDTIEVHIANPATAMYYAEYGEWMVNAEDDEKAVHFVLVGAESTKSPVGEYDESDVETSWSSIEFVTGYDDEHLPIYNAIYFRELDYLIISGEEGNYALEALVMGEDGNVYAISVNQTEGIDEVISNQHAGSSRKVIIGGIIYIIRDGKAYNMQGILVK